MLIQILSLSAFSLLLLSTAQPPPPPLSAASADYLDAHNRARADVGVAPLQWSPALARTADLTVSFQRNNRNCSFADLSNSQYGGNQLWAGGFVPAAKTVVESWVAEKQFYSYVNNSCAAERRCGVYTQVVWRKTAEVGCGQAVCGKATASLSVCLYNPPGNVVGEKPY